MANIRPATVNDLASVIALNQKIFFINSDFDEDIIPDFAQTPEGEKYFKEAIEDKRGCFFILEENGEMIGYTNGSPVVYMTYRKSKYFEITNVGVIPEKQGQGFGKMLMEAITSWAKEKGFQKIYLNCYAKNTKALDFYKKNGYSIMN